ncbi:MAG: hypothetical protein HFH26_00210 [Clostridiaceae bacterium]|nr:hypothetical protein [Clostridiaceae bacterium]
MKKISLILTFLFLFTMLTPALAFSESPMADDAMNSLLDALEVVEQEKKNFNLADIDFSDIYIGDTIHAYEFADGSFTDFLEIHPLFHSEQLIALSLSSDSIHQQIITALVDKINDIHPTKIALIYDATSCYLYDGKTLHFLIEDPETVEGRDEIYKEFDNINFNQIQLVSLVPTEKLNYTSPSKAKAQTYYACNVDYVPQDDSNICWAACVACIVNYVKGDSLTSTDVSTEYFGEYQNTGLNGNEIVSAYNDIYKLRYKFTNGISDNLILDNIMNDYPVHMVGIFPETTKKVAHACVGYGINPVSGYITIMNPLYGFTTIYSKNGEYSYISPTTGMRVVFAATISRYT